MQLSVVSLQVFDKIAVSVFFFFNIWWVAKSLILFMLTFCSPFVST